MNIYFILFCSGFAPIAIGFTLGALAAVGGSVSGGCFNLARLTSGAIWSGNFDSQYVYWFGELLGAASAAGVRHIFTLFTDPTQVNNNNANNANFDNDSEEYKQQAVAMSNRTGNRRD